MADDELAPAPVVSMDAINPLLWGAGASPVVPPIDGATPPVDTAPLLAPPITAGPGPDIGADGSVLPPVDPNQFAFPPTNWGYGVALAQPQANPLSTTNPLIASQSTHDDLPLAPPLVAPAENDKRTDVGAPGTGATPPPAATVANEVAGHIETPAEKWAHDPLNPQAIAEMGGPAAEQAYAAMSPEERISYDNQRAATKQHMFAAKQADMARANADRAQKEWDDYQTASAAAKANTQSVLDDAKKLSEQKIDPSGFMHSRTLFQTIAASVSVILGGIAQGLGAKSNVGLDMIMKATEQNIEAQRDNIANQRAALGLRSQAAGQQAQEAQQQYHAETAYRIASYQTAIDGLQTELQNYDQAGTTVQRGGQAIAQLRQAQAQAAASYEKETREYNLKLMAEQRQEDAQRETMRHNKVGEGLDWAKFGLEKDTKSAEKTVHPPDYFASLYGKDAAPPKPMTEKQFETYLGTKKNIREADEKDTAGQVFGSPAVARNTDGSIGFKAQPLIQGDGKTVFKPAGGAEAAKELRQEFKGTSNVVRDIDAMIALREQSGWSSDISKNADWQKLHARFGDSIPQILKSEGLNRMTEQDIEVLKQFMGKVEDPTRWNGITPGLQEARKILTEHYNNALTSEKYDGKPVSFPDTSKNIPPSEDLINEAARAAEDKNTVEEHGTLTAIGSAVGGGQGLRDIAINRGRAQRAVAIAKLQEWAASHDPKVADRAHQALDRLSRNSDLNDVRDAANDALVDHDLGVDQ